MSVPFPEPNPVKLAAVPRKTWQVGTLRYTAPGLVVLFCWLFWGDFAWSMKERTVGPVLQVMLKKFEASDFQVGLLMGSLPLIISMVLSPIVAYRSDRHRGPWGRRLPFLLLPTPVAVLAMLGLAFSPECGIELHRILGSDSPGINLSTIVFLGAFWVVFEIATIIANAVFGGLINDVVPAQFLGRFYGVFRALSLLAGIVFNLWLIGKAEEEYTWIFLGMGSLYGVGFCMMCLNVKEGEYPPPPPPNPTQGPVAFFQAVKEYLIKCFSIRYYWWVYASSALAAMAFMPFNLYVIYYRKTMGLSLETYGHYLVWTFIISLIIAYPLGVLVDRFHAFRVSLIVLAIYVSTTLAAAFYVVDAWTFGLALLIHGVMSGTYFTTSASLALRLLPRGNFAQFASASGIVASVFGIMVAPVSGRILDLTGHEYRYTFFMSGGIGAVGLLAAAVLYRKFLALGGPGNYRAPE